MLWLLLEGIPELALGNRDHAAKVIVYPLDNAAP